MKKNITGMAIKAGQPPLERERIDASNPKKLAIAKNVRSFVEKILSIAALNEIIPIKIARSPNRMALVKPSARPIVLYW